MIARVVGGAEACEGLRGPVGSRTFLAGTVAEAQAAAFAEAGLALAAEGRPGGTGGVSDGDALEAPRDAVFSADAVRAALALGRAKGAVLAAPAFTTAAPIVALRGAAPGLRWRPGTAADLATPDVAASPFDPDERDLRGLALPGGAPLRVADAYVYPVGHWVELLWANLLGLGPFLWRALVGKGPAAVFRFGGAALRAWSLRPEDVAARLNVVRPGARIHRSATVEGCWLGPGARVGAGAVVRGAVLGEEAVVEELALVEGTVLGRGARVQRLAMAKFCVIEEAAAFAGVAQLGVVGRGAVVKHGATLMDMAFGQGVRVRVGGALVDAPHGLCGVCVGDGAVLASGVRVAPGRALPPGVEVLLDPASVLRAVDVPPGTARAVVRDGRLDPTS